MKPNHKILIKFKGDSYEIRPLKENDISEIYVSWLNDPETAKFMAVKAGLITINSQREYVRNIINSEFNAIFGLFDEGGQLLGTSGVQKINSPEGGPWMGVLIGSKNCRGRGLGKILIWTVVSILFAEYNLKSIKADMYVDNVGSYKAFLGAGFVDIGNNIEKKNVKIVNCTRESMKNLKEMGVTEFQLSRFTKGGLL